MKVYILIINDRHSDIDVEVFSDKEKSITQAKALAKKYCRHEDDYEERKVADWIFYAQYSCEGNSITVLEKEVL